jgi:mono/diheme cytochrome c family protein
MWGLLHRKQFLFSLALLLLVSSFACKRREYASGEAAFEGKCVKCHKLNGEGGTKGPDLTGIFAKKDENYVRTYTQDPRSLKADGTMPPSDLSDHELDLLVQYLKEQSKPGRQ